MKLAKIAYDYYTKNYPTGEIPEELVEGYMEEYPAEDEFKSFYLWYFENIGLRPLIDRIVSLKDDSYLNDHFEWNMIVKDAESILPPEKQYPAKKTNLSTIEVIDFICNQVNHEEEKPIVIKDEDDKTVIEAISYLSSTFHDDKMRWHVEYNENAILI